VSDYQRNRQWSDRFIPELRRLIGPHLLIPSTLEQDTREAADLVVLRAKNFSVACRVRRPGYLSKYEGQFTLRYRVVSGAETELSKIAKGWGDWMFYGYAVADDSTSIRPWWLIDLAAFRAHFIQEAFRKEHKIRWGEKSNNDGTWFCWFDIASFIGDPKLLIASEAAAETKNHEPVRSRSQQCKHRPEFIDNGVCWICSRTSVEVSAQR
jgi:hypothetical protein